MHTLSHTCPVVKLIIRLALGLVQSKVGGGPAKIQGTAGRFHGNRLSGETALQVATHQHCHTEGTSVTSVEILTLPDTYRGPIPLRGGMG